MMQLHTCDVLVGGAVRCWGYNVYSQVMLLALFGEYIYAHAVHLKCSHFVIRPSSEMAEMTLFLPVPLTYRSLLVS
jgi:hypothetical protein